jgi:hypothetical protein
VPQNDILSRDHDLHKSSYRHTLLVKGHDFASARNRVLHFFKQYQLVRYSRVTISEADALNALQDRFMNAVGHALEENRRIVHDLAEELRAEGICTLEDLERIPQGYQSKMLHVITHFMDGFFGIDTFFYNLEEDSHWVSEEFLRKIRSEPSFFWLLTAYAVI